MHNIIPTLCETCNGAGPPRKPNSKVCTMLLFVSPVHLCLHFQWATEENMEIYPEDQRGRALNFYNTLSEYDGKLSV